MCLVSNSAITMLADFVECHMFSCYELYTNTFELVNLYKTIVHELTFWTVLFRAADASFFAGTRVTPVYAFKTGTMFVYNTVICTF